MVRFSFAVLAAPLATMLLATSVQAQSVHARRMEGADDQACAMLRASRAGLDPLIKTLKAQANRFPAPVLEGLVAQVAAQLRSIPFRDAALFRVYELPGYARHYSMPMATDDKTIFVALTYEVYAGEPTLVSFKYHARMQEAFEVPFIGEPVPVECSG